MLPNEKQLTGAQRELLHFVTTSDPDTLYRSLSTTLIMSVMHHVPEEIGSESRPPTSKVLEAWYFTLELMERLHGMCIPPDPA